MKPNPQSASSGKIRAFIMAVTEGREILSMVRAVSTLKHKVVHPEKVYAITGEYDLLICVEAPTLPLLTEFLSEKLLLIDGIGKTFTSIALVVPGKAVYKPKHPNSKFPIQAFIFFTIDPKLLFKVLNSIVALSPDSVLIETADVVTGKY